MGPDYGHPIRLIYHTGLILVAITVSILLTAWAWSKMFRGPDHINRYHWSGFVWSIGLMVIWLIVFLVAW